MGLATIGIPTIAMILLFLLPFYDRSPERRPERRPIATTTAIVVIGAMALLTYQGANAGSPTTIEAATPPSIVAAGGNILAEYEAGKKAVAQSGCLACHKIGDNGNAGPGPNLTHIGARLPHQAIARTLVNPTAPMPSFKTCRPQSSARSSISSRSANSSPPGAGSEMGAGRLPADQVRRMFDRIARVYDPMNTAMTAGLHHRWRARAADLTGLGAGQRVLDLATGTGDLALELGARVWPGGEVVGADFSEAMLDRARAKSARPPAGGAARPRVEPRFEWADAMSLPYPDDRLRRRHRRLRGAQLRGPRAGAVRDGAGRAPGGRVVVLEITTPTRAPLSLFYGLWFDRLVPALGRLAGVLARGILSRRAGAGEAIGEAYSYLPSSVKRFPEPPELAAEMGRAGIAGVAGVLLAGGIVAIHAGTVEESGRP